MIAASDGAMTSPTVDTYMSPSPHTIGVDQPLSKAHDFLRMHHVRHLPVLDGGRLVGMLTERDLGLVEALPGVDPTEVTVEDAMSSSVYAVAPGASLARVAEEMAEHRYGSAVVMDAGKVIGIFTTVDACRALADTLRSQGVL